MHLPAIVYSVIRRLVPIACVDALPYRETPGGLEIGLIQRLDAHGQTRVWNLVGGRVRYGESLAHALDRHLLDALGPSASWQLPDVERPSSAAEYFPRASRRNGPVRMDSRKHAIALGYAVKVEGDVDPGGEALSFRWFSPREIPSHAEIGFDQRDVIETLVGVADRITAAARDLH